MLSLIDRLVTTLRIAVMVVLLTGVGGGLLNAAVIKVACVGDSITAGAGASSSATNYPSVLTNLLGSGYLVGNFGRSGATLLKNGDFPYWNQPEFTNSDAFAPDIVVIMLGTNDSKAGPVPTWPNNWLLHQNEFVGDYEALIDHYRALPSHPLVFCCIICPVYGAGGFGITSPMVQEVIPKIIQAANAKAAPLIDVNTAMSGNAGYFLSDGVHPNDTGYAVLAPAVYGPIHPPVAASALSATAIAAGRIDLTWSSTSNNETGFAIERKIGAGGTYALIATAAVNATTFSDTTASASTTFVYRVRAVNASGTAAATNEATATTPAAPPSSNSGHCGGGVLGAMILVLMLGIGLRLVRNGQRN